MTALATVKTQPGRLGVHGNVRTRLHDARTGLLVVETTDDNIETQNALNAIAAWIVGGANVVQYPQPQYIALGTGYPNLLSAAASGFETWPAGWSAASNCTVAQSSAQAFVGSYSMAMTASSAATMSATTAIGTGGVAVTAGNRYAVTAHLYPGTTQRQVQVGIAWYDSSGTLLSTTTQTSVTTEAAAAWTRCFHQDTAPTNAAFAAVQVTVLSAGNGEVHYVDAVQLEAAWDGPSAYQVGGQTGTPGVNDTVLYAERVNTRKQVDAGFTQQGLAALLHTYQTSDPSGTFAEAGLFTGAAGAASLSAEAAAGATTLALVGGAPAVVAGQQIWVGTGIPLGLDLTDNLLSAAQASFESTPINWAAVSGCSVAQSAAKAYIGSNSMAVTATGAGTATATTPTGTSGILITPGSLYAASGWYLAGSTTETCKLQIVWYDATGTVISTSTGTGVTDSASVWTRAEVVAAAPSNAVYAAVQAVVTVGANGEVHYLDGVFFSAAAGEYATVAAAATAGASSWTLTDQLAMTHPTAAAIAVFNGTLWAHVLLTNVAKTGTQLLSVQWEVELVAS